MIWSHKKTNTAIKITHKCNECLELAKNFLNVFTELKAGGALSNNLQPRNDVTLVILAIIMNMTCKILYQYVIINQAMLTGQMLFFGRYLNIENIASVFHLIARFPFLRKSSNLNYDIYIFVTVYYLYNVSNGKPIYTIEKYIKYDP